MDVVRIFYNRSIVLSLIESKYSTSKHSHIDFFSTGYNLSFLFETTIDNHRKRKKIAKFSCLWFVNEKRNTTKPTKMLSYSIIFYLK